MSGGNPLLQILLGRNYRQLQDRRRAKRAQRRAAKTVSGPGRTWAGQTGQRPTTGLRPPPPPGGPEAGRHPWDGGRWDGRFVTGQPGATVPQPPAEESGTRRLAVPGPPPEPSGEQGSSPEPAAGDGAPSESAQGPWVPVAELPRESWWAHARRVVVVAVAVLVVVAGTVSVVETVVGWLPQQRAPQPPPAVTEVRLAGFAETVAVDYLSWSPQHHSARQSALARYAAAGSGADDGWNGDGRMLADTASTVDLTRGDAGVIATVRVRVTPVKAAPPGAGAAGTAPASPVGGAVASAPAVLAAAGTAQPSRWLTVGVPITTATGVPRVSATPGLVGSAPDEVAGPAVPSGVGDDAFAKATEPTITKLLRAYASGDLSYARAAGTHFAGLGGAVQFQQLERWRVRPAEAGDARHRVGDATVTWSVPGGAELTCSYRVRLEHSGGRWFLSGLTVQTKDVDT